GEKMNQILNFNKRGTSILSGDGARAMLIANDGEDLPEYDSSLYSQGDENLSIAVAPNEEGDITLTMNGREVFNFVQRTVLPSLDQFVNKQESLYYIISHQENYSFIKMKI